MRQASVWACGLWKCPLYVWISPQDPFPSFPPDAKKQLRSTTCLLSRWENGDCLSSSPAVIGQQAATIWWKMIDDQSSAIKPQNLDRTNATFSKRSCIRVAIPNLNAFASISMNSALRVECRRNMGQISKNDIWEEICLAIPNTSLAQSLLVNRTLVTDTRQTRENFH